MRPMMCGCYFHPASQSQKAGKPGKPGKPESLPAWKANVVILRRGIRPAMLMLASLANCNIITYIYYDYDDVNVLVLPFF